MQNNETVKWTEKLGYGIGGAATTIMLFQYHMLYLTNVVFLDIAVISGIMAVSRIFDGISDVLIGGLIDNTESVHGKARIWILRMCLPMAVSMILMFYVPASFPDAIKYVYVFIIYNLFTSVFRTFINIAHSSLLSFMTSDPADHRHILSIGGVIQRGWGMLFSFAFVKLLLVFTSEPGNHLTQRGFLCTISLVAGCSIIMYIVEFLLTKERVHPDTGKQEVEGHSKKGLLSEIKLLITDKYWLILFIISMINMLAGGAMSGTLSYYCLYIMKDIEAIATFTVIEGVSGIIASFLLVLIGRKIGTIKMLIFSCLMSAVARIGIFIAGTNKLYIFAFTALTGMAMVGMIIALGAMVPLVVTYSQKKNGRMVPGVGNAFVNAARKLGLGVANVIVGLLMSWAGFNARLDAQGIAQPHAVLNAIQMCFCWIPAIVAVIVAVITALFCDVEKKMKEMDA